MSEEQKLDKTKLPTKTLIAALWLAVMGVILTSWHLVLLLMSFGYSFAIGTADERRDYLLLVLLFGSILYTLSGFFLPIRIKWAWIVAVAILCIVLICSLGIDIYIFCKGPFWITIGLLLGSLIYLTPIILLILDRKNYFEMLRQLDKNKVIQS